jgi:multidrug resistance efflux pump
LKRRIEQLEESLEDKERLFNIQQIGWKECEADLRAAQNQVEYLVRTIRDIDEQIYKMSQCTSWAVMRPNFLNLEEGMISRKRAESDRIGELIRPELIKTYGTEETKEAYKQIEKKRGF